MEDLQKGQFALVNVISNIQENVTSGKDHANNSEDEEEKPPVPKSVLSLTGPLGEPIERPNITYKSPTLGEREGAKLPHMTFEMEHGTPFAWPRKPIRSGLPMEIVPLTKTESEPDITWVMAPPALVVHQERIFTFAMPSATIAKSNTKLVD